MSWNILLQEPPHHRHLLRRKQLGELVEAEGFTVRYEFSFEDVGQIEEMGTGI